MLSSSPVSTIQIVAVTGAVLLILGLGDAALVSQLTGMTGRGLRRIFGSIRVSKDSGESKARED